MPFSVEFLDEIIQITSLDRTGNDEDVIVEIYDDGMVYILQHENSSGGLDIIELNYDQLKEIAAALQLPEGMYRLDKQT